MEGGRPIWKWFQKLFGELSPLNKLFGDKSANRVHIQWLPFVANLDDVGSYSQGSAALAWLYRCMCQENKDDSVLSIDRVPDPGPSVEFLDWWHRVTHMVLSPRTAFADPRPEEEAGWDGGGIGEHRVRRASARRMGAGGGT
ncbi:hypothetical protein Ahy_B01g052398 [Arachis hypogaea]|uniref:Aminotransferase-like plant mobile domain-containing protein n=1 Tax=Arachis hypogaea TaxID=3818 RepID=A0A445APC1_ARAHY|nr:hypothetical protein Ahy_B01g052398 [Arachis hypogaea]